MDDNHFDAFEHGRQLGPDIGHVQNPPRGEIVLDERHTLAAETGAATHARLERYFREHPEAKSLELHSEQPNAELWAELTRHLDGVQAEHSAQREYIQPEPRLDAVSVINPPLPLPPQYRHAPHTGVTTVGLANVPDETMNVRASELTPEQKEDMRVYGATFVDEQGQRVDPTDPRLRRAAEQHKRLRDEIDMFRPSADELSAQKAHQESVRSVSGARSARSALFAAALLGMGFGGMGARPGFDAVPTFDLGGVPRSPAEALARSCARPGYGKASAEKKAKRKAARKARRGNR